MPADPFHHNVTIITGASMGLGAEMARQLADRGAKLILAARSADILEKVAADCRARGADALAVPTDVADEAACRALVERTVEEYGHIDTLINNAGISMWATFDQLNDLSRIEKIMQVNLLGGVYLTYYALPHLKQSGGRIAAISSLAGKTGVPARTGYSASKHAQVGFFEALRVELLESPVTITIVFPSYVATGIHERVTGPDGQPLGKDHPVDYDKAMPIEKAAQLTLTAIANRRRQLVMTPRGKFGQWLKLIAPGLVDRIALRAIETGR